MLETLAKCAEYLWDALLISAVCYFFTWLIYP
jgi:hypothetical protein